MDAKALLTEQINEAVSIWQNSMTKLNENPSEAAEEIIRYNLKFSEMIATSISNYIKGLAVMVASPTQFGTAGTPEVIVSTGTGPAVQVVKKPNLNHGYLNEVSVNATYNKTGVIFTKNGVKQQYISYSSVTPTIIRK